MIDVMMFLLVFFVLISINVLPALGLKIKPPSSAKPDQIVEHNRITISLDPDGNTFVDGIAVALGDIPAKLADAAAKDMSKKLVVVIAGDEAAHLQNLIDVLDALKIAGVGSAQIVAKKKPGLVPSGAVTTPAAVSAGTPNAGTANTGTANTGTANTGTASPAAAASAPAVTPASAATAPPSGTAPAQQSTGIPEPLAGTAK